MGCMRDLKKEDVDVDHYMHDCMYVLESQGFDKYFKVKGHLDGLHHKKHKCKTKRAPRRFNSQAAEQLWARMDKMSGWLTNMSRPRYRFLLKHYCLWRNAYSRMENLRRSDNPSMSSRRVAKKKTGKRQLVVKCMKTKKKKS